jgi:cytochrome c
MKRILYRICLGSLFCISVPLSTVLPVNAQVVPEPAKPPSGRVLFERQCATCHTSNTTDAPRQGPTLFGVFGRKAGSVATQRYSAALSKSDWEWDSSHLDTWLSNSQAMVPGTFMLYKQAKPEVRTAIIEYLKELH